MDCANARAWRPSAPRSSGSIRSEIAGAVGSRWRCGRPPSRRTGRALATNSLPIAEVAYREGEVGILELLDAVRTAARARTAQHRHAA